MQVMFVYLWQLRCAALRPNCFDCRKWETMSVISRVLFCTAISLGPFQYTIRRVIVRSRKISKWQSQIDRTSLNTNLAASRLCEILQKDLLLHIEMGLRTRLHGCVRSPAIMPLIRELFWLSAIFNFDIEACKILSIKCYPWFHVVS